MEPDPIRRAFAHWSMNRTTAELVEMGGEVDAFVAGAKWAAREAAKCAETVCVGEMWTHPHSCCNEIRKHFGVEG